jgi:A/G-specific adenine glycosylase
MEKASPSEFNQAMMEIGALICIAKNPRCTNCPVSAYCKAYLKGEQARYPDTIKPKKVEEIEVVLGIIFNNSLVYIQKRPSQGLFAGLWEFPGGKIEIGESPEKALQRELKEELGRKVRIISHEKSIRHNYTRFKVLLHPFICSAQKRFSPVHGKKEFLWISQEELKKYAFPAANRKIIQTLGRL